MLATAEKQSAAVQLEPERALTPEMTEEAYTASRDRLVEAIGAADEILRALRAYTDGSDDWVARYPESTPQKPLSRHLTAMLSRVCSMSVWLMRFRTLATCAPASRTLSPRCL